MLDIVITILTQTQNPNFHFNRNTFYARRQSHNYVSVVVSSSKDQKLFFPFDAFF